MSVIDNHKIVAIIPAYKVSKFIVKLLDDLVNYVDTIVVVDDKCPEESGRIAESYLKENEKFNSNGKISKVIFHQQNFGVGGAMVSGYKEALELGGTVMVKLDGDGQMSPKLISKIIAPIIEERADYSKGNRFFMIESLKGMPALRVFGNSVLSIFSKFSHGYWNIMDPTNGFVAIHESVLRRIPLEKIEKRYFFENDMLFRLSTLRAVVCDVPMDSLYGDEKSSLNIPRVIKEFPPKFLIRFFKRIFYNYFLRDFTICTVELIFGVALVLFGFTFGIIKWLDSAAIGLPASAGTVMIAGLPIMLGLNLLIAALNYDILNTPSEPLQRFLKKR